MSEHEMHPEEDAVLRTALRQALPDPPVDGLDWASLHGRITAQAAPLLAARRRPVPGLLATLGRWSPRMIPLTAAAAAALLIVVANGPEPRAGTIGQGVAFVTLEEELSSGLGDSSAMMAGSVGDDELYDALLFYAGESR